MSIAPVKVKGLQVRADGPSAAEVDQALTRMLAELEFARNPSPTRFLQFVVSETLAGRGERLKAYAIATRALGRSENFDPQSDSIVRVQAVRLRSMLNSYYAGSGAQDIVRIAIPVGTYQAKFAYAALALPPPHDAPAASPSEPSLTPPTGEPATPANTPARVGLEVDPWRKKDRSAVWRVLAPAAFVIFALVVVLLTFAIGSRPHSGATHTRSLDHPPVILVDVPEAPPQIKASVGAQQFLASLEQGLASLDYVNVRVATPSADAGPTDYVLTTRFIQAGQEQADADLILRRTDTGDVLWSRQLSPFGLDAAENALQARHQASGAVAALDGAIFSDLRAILLTLPKGELRGYACGVAAREYLRKRELQLHDGALNCLKASVAAEPENVELLVSLSTVVLTDYLEAIPESQSSAGLQAALQLARRAYDLAPQRGGAQAAMFYARFFDKRFEDAFQIAQQAIATNPESLTLALRLGRAYVSRGRYAEGVDWLNKADFISAGEHPIGTAFLALAKHMRGDFDAERRLLSRSAAAQSAMGLTLRIIDCHARGDTACVQFALVKLRQDFPGFAADVPAALDRYALVESQQDYLLQGLRAAGFAGVN